MGSHFLIFQLHNEYQTSRQNTVNVQWGFKTFQSHPFPSQMHYMSKDKQKLKSNQMKGTARNSYKAAYKDTV